MLIKQQWFTCDELVVQIVIVLGGEIANREDPMSWWWWWWIVEAEPWMSWPRRFLARWV